MYMCRSDPVRLRVCPHALVAQCGVFVIVYEQVLRVKCHKTIENIYMIVLVFVVREKG